MAELILNSKSSKTSIPPTEFTHSDCRQRKKMILNHLPFLYLSLYIEDYIQPNQSPVLRIVKLKVISLYMHYLDTNIVTSCFIDKYR